MSERASTRPHAGTLKLLREFHSRQGYRREDRPLNRVLPRVLLPRGYATNVLYYCDKRDPADPKGEGRQGVWKLFTHKHGSMPMLYDINCVLGSDETTDEPLTVAWPRAVAWLGDLVELEWEDEVAGYTETFAGEGRHSPWGLYCWPDRRTLMAVPYRDPIGDVILWRGPGLYVDEWGIHG